MIGSPAALAMHPPELPPQLRAGSRAWKPAARQQLARLSDAGLLPDISGYLY